MNSNTLALAKALINRASVTPEDAGCQQLIAERLSDAGFAITHLPFGKVNNLWATHGNDAPLFAFLGHTDVVPTGPHNAWQFPPFNATEHKGQLYGRGAADMKSSIAAMITASERFIARHPKHQGTIAFLLTSDEEGQAIDGTSKVIAWLQEKNVAIDWCLVGEPSSEASVGDTLKIGRRGSLSATLTIYGKQGHIAYPHLADNPINHALPVFNTLVETIWENKKHPYFPATSFQISNLNAGTGATNVIPGQLTAMCNFRYSPSVTAESLKNQLEDILKTSQLAYAIDWQHGGKPFLTEKGKLLESCINAIQSHQAITPKLSTDGGTSDGRFIAPTGSEVIELGVVNATIHQINESVNITELEILSTIYETVLENLFNPTKL